MKSLIIKDFLTIKSNIKHLLLIIIMFLLLCFDNTHVLHYIPSFLSIIILILLFSYDEVSHFNCYLNTMPIDKKNIVKSKYLVGLILNLIAIIITFIECLFLNFKVDFNSLILCLAITMIIEALILPLIFKFGVERVRIFLIILVLIIGLILTIILTKFTLSNKLTIFITKNGSLIFMLLGVVLIFISYQISKNIYLNKDF